jgi:hypothetical protein
MSRHFVERTYERDLQFPTDGTSGKPSAEVVANNGEQAVTGSGSEPEGRRRMTLKRTQAGFVGVALTAALVMAACGSDETAQLQAPRANQQRTAELASIAEWADTEGLTGLSPASLTAIDPNQQRTAELASIAEWADTEGLTGLSPASLRPVEG